MDNALSSSGIWGDAAVLWAFLSEERRLYNRQDMVEAVGERRWCNGPCRGPGPQHLGTTRRCTGSVVRGEAAVQQMIGGGAAVCLYFICTWAWAGSIGGRRGITLLIELKIKIFFCVRDIFQHHFFWRIFLPSVGYRVG